MHQKMMVLLINARKLGIISFSFGTVPKLEQLLAFPPVKISTIASCFVMLVSGLCAVCISEIASMA